MRLLVTPTFDRTTKKLHRQQKADLDDAVQAVACDTTVGETKVGDLAGIQVYKFKMASQLCLLAYGHCGCSDGRIFFGCWQNDHTTRTGLKPSPHALCCWQGWRD